MERKNEKQTPTTDVGRYGIELLPVIEVANSDPEGKTESGKKAWKILNSLFDEAERNERKTNKL